MQAADQLRRALGPCSCPLQVKPTHVLNAAGLTGRPNVDWCEDHKVGATSSASVSLQGYTSSMPALCPPGLLPSLNHVVFSSGLRVAELQPTRKNRRATRLAHAGRDHPLQRDWLPEPGRCVPPAQYPHDLLRHRLHLPLRRRVPHEQRQGLQGERQAQLHGLLLLVYQGGGAGGAASEVPGATMPAGCQQCSAHQISGMQARIPRPRDCGG